MAIAALRRVEGWTGGRAKLRRRQSGRDETETNPDVRIGATSRDASSASEDVSQSWRRSCNGRGWTPQTTDPISLDDWRRRRSRGCIWRVVVCSKRRSISLGSMALGPAGRMNMTERGAFWRNRSKVTPRNKVAVPVECGDQIACRLERSPAGIALLRRDCGICSLELRHLIMLTAWKGWLHPPLFRDRHQSWPMSQKTRMPKVP